MGGKPVASGVSLPGSAVAGVALVGEGLMCAGPALSAVMPEHREQCHQRGAFKSWDGAWPKAFIDLELPPQRRLGQSPKSKVRAPDVVVVIIQANPLFLMLMTILIERVKGTLKERNTKADI